MKGTKELRTTNIYQDISRSAAAAALYQPLHAMREESARHPSFLHLCTIVQSGTKPCVKISIEKSMVIFSVNLLENLHASTYDIYNYIYKVRKNATDGNSDL